MLAFSSPTSKLDFGWGRPALGSYHFPWGEDAKYVMPMLSSTKDGDWVVEAVHEYLERVVTKELNHST